MNGHRRDGRGGCEGRVGVERAVRGSRRTARAALAACGGSAEAAGDVCRAAARCSVLGNEGSVRLRAPHERLPTGRWAEAGCSPCAGFELLLRTANQRPRPAATLGKKPESGEAWSRVGRQPATESSSFRRPLRKRARGRCEHCTGPRETKQTDGRGPAQRGAPGKAAPGAGERPRPPRTGCSHRADSGPGQLGAGVRHAPRAPAGPPLRRGGRSAHPATIEPRGKQGGARPRWRVGCGRPARVEAAERGLSAGLRQPQAEVSREPGRGRVGPYCPGRPLLAPAAGSRPGAEPYSSRRGSAAGPAWPGPEPLGTRAPPAAGLGLPRAAALPGPG